MVLPGSEIPEWFGDKGIGSSLTIQLPSNCRQLKGIAFCLVFLLHLPSHDMPYEVDDRSYVHVEFDYHVKSKNGEQDGDDEVVLASQEERALLHCLKTSHSDHMILHYELELCYMGRKAGLWIRRPFELKSYGVYLHFDENLPAADKSLEEN
ncbi:hypothetical protein Peur_025651 [Populus x canadensis]